MMKQLVRMALSVMLGYGPALSQFSLTAGTTAMADDNVSNSYERGSDRVTLLTLKPSYAFETEASTTELWYDGSFALYSVFTDRTFQYHSVGMTHVRTFGDEDAGTMEIAADYAARWNRESFMLFDHTTYGLAAAAEYYFTEKFAGAARYAFHSTSFAQLGDFDYREHTISLKQSLQLLPTTTIILHNEVGIKNYAHSISADSALLAQGGTMSGKVQRTVQLVSSLRIGQSLGEKTGLSLSAGYRYNFQQSARYLASEYGSLSEDELFNDHYGYEGLREGVLLTHLLPSAITLRLRFDHEQRDYALLGAYDLAGVQTAAQRQDGYNVYSATIEKKWENFPLTLMLSYEYIKNASNDAYYNYTNNVFSVGLTVPF
jgi:hypothetical protein